MIKHLHRAKKEKNDEFYTQLIDIENELQYYTDYFKGKIVYCNCDSHESNFFIYFKSHYQSLNLKGIICTSYNINGIGKKCEYYGETVISSDLEGDGDFRSDECIELLKKCDIVCTNPPFSLFRQYISQLMEYNKDFLIIGNVNAISYKEIFPLIQKNRMWLGVTLFTGKMPFFRVPDDYEITNSRFERRADGLYKQVNSIAWYTNLDHKKRHKEIVLTKRYDEDKYPKYDNYAAINVSRTSDIPMDYNGIMGVPITFLDKYNPNQFEIIGITENADYLKSLYVDGYKKYDRPYINGKRMYIRLLIRKK